MIKAIQAIQSIKKNPDSDFLSGGTDLSLKVTKDRQEIKKNKHQNE